MSSSERITAEILSDPALSESEREYGPVGCLVYGAYWGLVHRVISHNEGGSVTVETIEHPLNNPQWRGDRSMFRVKTHCTRIGVCGSRDRIIALPIRGL